MKSKSRSPEEELLAMYYGKASEQLENLAKELLEDGVDEFDELSEDEQEMLMSRAKQDILLNNTDLASILGYLDILSNNAAIKNLGETMGDSLSDQEARAVILEEQLRILQKTGLEVQLVTGHKLVEAEASGDYAAHPNQYDTLNQMAQAAGISVSESSDMKALAGTIFPYLETTLGLDGRELWGKIGKSRFRQITPLLRTMIDPAREGTDRVQAKIKKLRELAAADKLIDTSELTNEDAVRYLLGEAETQTYRNLDERLSPEEIAPFELEATFTAANRVTIKGYITADDLELMQKLLGRHANINIVTLT